MAHHSRLHVLNTMIETALVPVFYNGDFETSKQIIDACIAGGARTIEFTNRGDFAYDVFTQLSKHYVKASPEVILGVGSIVDAPTAAMYIASGANFVVGPVLNAEVAKVCNRRKVAYSPGCGSASEISAAEELGVEIVKIFPGDSVGGPEFVKAIAGPCPWTRIMPTGGVDSTEESIRKWFKAGVAAVGMGSKLITKERVSKGDFDAIGESAAQIIEWIKGVRRGG